MRKILMVYVFLAFGFGLGVASGVSAEDEAKTQLAMVSECLDAHAAGDLDVMAKVAKQISTWRGLSDLETIRLAEDCLTMNEARPVLYSTVAQAFQFDTRQVPSMLDEAHPALLRMIDEARLDCRNQDEGVLTVPESATVFMDINNDDAPEIFFDFGQVECSTTNNLYAGSLGRKLGVIVDAEVTTFWVRGWTVEYPFGGNLAVLLTWVHGSFCDRAGVRPCVLSYVWSEGEFLTAKF